MNYSERNAWYMNNIQQIKFEEMINGVLDDIEQEATNGKSNIRIYVGSSDDNKEQLLNKINLITNKLSSLGFKIERSHTVEWRFLISNLVNEYLDIYW